jgi:hypothetical protein
MAVESKSTNGAPTRPSAKRISSLMKQGSALPTVESSLDEFIAKANQTLVDVSSWEQQAKQAREEDAQRREQDAQRWKAAESQLRESEVRETSLRRQLDGLQGKLAEAEARVAIAISSAASGSMAAQQSSAMSEAAIRELRTQIEDATARMHASEARSAELGAALASAKAEVAARFANGSVNITDDDNADADARIKLAEAKAVKALAAARAAAAGLTVSSADLAAIESGLIVAVPPRRKSPWLAVTLAFVGGLAIMGGVWKFVLDQPSAPAAQAAAAPAPVQPAAQPAPITAPTSAPAPAPAPAVQAKAPEAPRPTVTPIEETPRQPTVTPIEDTKPEPAKTEKPKAVAKRPTHAAAPKKAAATLADPFAEPAKKAEPKKDDKPKGNIVDPF